MVDAKLCCKRFELGAKRPVTDDDESRVRQPRVHERRRMQEERRILFGRQAPDIANQRGSAGNGGGDPGTRNEALAVDTIANERQSRRCHAHALRVHACGLADDAQMRPGDAVRFEILHRQVHRMNRGEHRRVRDPAGERAHGVRSRHVRMDDADVVLAHQGHGELDRLPAQPVAHRCNMHGYAAVAQRGGESAFERAQRRQPDAFRGQVLRKAQHRRLHAADDRVAGDGQHAKRRMLIAGGLHRHS